MTAHGIGRRSAPAGFSVARAAIQRGLLLAARAALLASMSIAIGCAGDVIVEDDTTTGDDEDLCENSPGATECGGLCVWTAADPANCGGCGVECQAGETCVGATCTACPPGAPCPQECPAGFGVCDSECVDLAIDPENCGGCGIACSSPETCMSGVCKCAPAGTTNCGSYCANLDVSEDDCGACGNLCVSGAKCEDGTCQCPAGETVCQDACVNLASDIENCGACDVACLAGHVCMAGACQCPSGTSECGGACVNLSNDEANCGACGAACTAAEVCSGGACACAPGTISCGGACANVATDPANCGACGQACAAGDVCAGGLCLDVVSTWPTFAGNMRRSGENAVETAGPPNATGWSVGLSAGALHPVIIDGERVIATFGGGGPNDVVVVRALSLLDGTTLWTHEYDELYSIGQPTIVDGKLYLATGKAFFNGVMAMVRAYDAASGAPLWTSEIGAQWETYWAPAVSENRVFVNGGYYGGLYGFDATTGAELFFNDDLEQYDEWSPAIHDGKLFSYVAGQLRSHNTTTGAVQWTANPGWDWAGWSMMTAPAFDDERAFVVAPPNLHAVNVATHAILWSVDANCKGTPAVTGGIVYAICGGNLQARDAATGALVWSFDSGDLSYPPIIAAGQVYVSGKTAVYAVDMATHQMTWTTATGGWLSIAAGRLFVARANGTLATFVLAN